MATSSHKESDNVLVFLESNRINIIDDDEEALFKDVAEESSANSSNCSSKEESSSGTDVATIAPATAAATAAAATNGSHVNLLHSKSNTSDDNCTESTDESSSRASPYYHDEEDKRECHNRRHPHPLQIGDEDEEETTTDHCHHNGDCENDDNDENQLKKWWHDLMWLTICFVGIMASFVAYGILLEYATTDHKKLPELSFLFVTSVLGTIPAYIGKTVRKEATADIPSNRFLLLGLMSLGSTFCAIRALRYVIFPVQVLARSCKPVPVMLIGALLGKKYPRRKYINVMFIVIGVALFMGGSRTSKEGDIDMNESSNVTDISVSFLNNNSTHDLLMDLHLPQTIPVGVYDDHEKEEEEALAWHQHAIGILLLLAGLCCDGGTGAYEDKLMRNQRVEPFDLMFRFQVAKMLLAGIALVLFNQIHLLIDMLQQTGISILALGLCSSIGQVFIFICIAKFGALTASLMSLTRKVTTLGASIVIFGHGLTAIQIVGLVVGLGAMLVDAFKPKKDKTLVLAPTSPSVEPKKTSVALTSESEEMQPMVGEP
mmetsp:Transcript_15553/g.20254  ORF Transcript_15553/g.20254 Transcript_15553/m.20254 type:complete len:545 (+) Transcript_15553:63-1697(+)|eukprot:CAMPEP_0198151272 /NCGR_PEP_ID=MMETSP1443-20131203/55002_1 /TAXON_ID=186043 /ORGANISM="Entomoneis sp., Strain CCMP2396" /LENGTH=544 /DNA_ID=CAMNT_0043816891 /DNA_START=41 /DNA_END=1675 /DNA_ORIENTATION=-